MPEIVQPAEIRILTAADGSAWWALRLEALESQPEAFTVRHKGQIWGVYVTARVRRTGVGRAVLRFLLAHAVKFEGIEQIAVSAATTQVAAIALYQSLSTCFQKSYRQIAC
ncbi:MAG TPA: GNAT family N-acetyltransferase [Bryobacteraceae bacterium]|nr:GNAT family N-acetyltransferase [Bryobacteraceae bacterium]